MSITRHLDVYMPLLSFQGFLTLPMAHVPCAIALACVLWIPQVRVQFGFQAAVDHCLGQFFEQSVFSQDVPLASCRL